MPRVKGGPRAHAKHKKILKLAKGYKGSRSKIYKKAHEAVLRAGEHAFAGRRIRRRDMRRLWISRLNGALTDHDVNYSTFINKMKIADVQLNRKMLSEIAIRDPKGFEEIVKKVLKK
jgi:large subunit ribosomal protein L20